MIIYDKELTELFEMSIESRCYFDIAMIVFYLYQNEFVVTSLKNKTWFCFKDHKWVKYDLGPYKQLSTIVIQKYKEYSASIKDEEQLANCNYILSMLKDVGVKEQVCKECLYLFYDESFIHKLDTKSNLIPYNNGVYDLTTKSLRDGKYDDYLSIYINLLFFEYDESFVRDFSLFRNEMISVRNKNNHRMYLTKNDLVDC
jgi:hypothetical protein